MSECGFVHMSTVCTGAGTGLGSSARALPAVTLGHASRPLSYISLKVTNKYTVP